MDARRLGELLALGSPSSGLGLLEGRLAALEVLSEGWYRAELILRTSSMGIERRHLPGEPLDGLAPRLVPLQQVLDAAQHAAVRLAEAARDGKASSEEMQGGTLTVTSLGPLGGVATTPVINRPEVAIIGPNRIIERPMYVSDGQGGERIEKRKLMNISISCDHRVVDGWNAASFVQALKRLLETPALILID